MPDIPLGRYGFRLPCGTAVLSKFQILQGRTAAVILLSIIGDGRIAFAVERQAAVTAALNGLIHDHRVPSGLGLYRVFQQFFMGAQSIGILAADVVGDRQILQCVGRYWYLDVT